MNNQFFIDVAIAAAKQVTCIRRKFGCVIVDPETNHVISTGFNGSPSGKEHCTDIGWCLREELNIPRGEGYEKCIVGESVIKLLDGTYKTIHELAQSGDSVWTYAIDSNFKVVPTLARNPRLTGYTNDIVEIKFHNSGSLKCTLDHLIMMRDGTWKQAQHLTPNDRVMPIYYNRFPNTSTGKLYEKISNNLRCRSEGGRIKLNYEPTKSIMAHTLIYEYLNNVKLGNNLFIHHKDENSLNNHPNNLEMVDRASHSKHHGNFDSLTYEQRLKFGALGYQKLMELYSKDPEYKKKKSETGQRNMKKNWEDPEFVRRHIIRTRESAKRRIGTKLSSEHVLNGCIGRTLAGIYELEIRSGVTLTADNYEVIAGQFPIRSKLGEKGNKVPRIKTILKYFKTLQEAIDLVHKQNHKVESVVFHKVNNIPVYCMTVDIHDNFAVDMGDSSCIIVHNCKSVHDFQNAVIQAGPRARGCYVYAVGFEANDVPVTMPKPCFLCTKMAINAGIEKYFVWTGRNLIEIDLDTLYDTYILEIAKQYTK